MVEKKGGGHGMVQEALSLILASREKSKALQTQMAFIHHPALEGSVGIYSVANLVPL
jgi:hypothetical protein